MSWSWATAGLDAQWLPGPASARALWPPHRPGGCYGCPSRRLRPPSQIYGSSTAPLSRSGGGATLPPPPTERGHGAQAATARGKLGVACVPNSVVLFLLRLQQPYVLSCHHSPALCSLPFSSLGVQARFKAGRRRRMAPRWLEWRVGPVPRWWVALLATPASFGGSGTNAKPSGRLSVSRCSKNSAIAEVQFLLQYLM